MKYAVRIGSNMEITKVRPEEGESFLDFCYRSIDCSCIEIVRVNGLPSDLVMVVDDEAMLVDKPMINFVGSFLYGTQKHMSPICGNILIVREALTDNGIDLVLMDEKTADLVAAKMDEMTFPAVMAIEPKLTKAGVLRRV